MTEVINLKQIAQQYQKIANEEINTVRVLETLTAKPLLTFAAMTAISNLGIQLHELSTQKDNLIAKIHSAQHPNSETSPDANLITQVINKIKELLILQDQTPEEKCLLALITLQIITSLTADPE